MFKQYLSRFLAQAWVFGLLAIPLAAHGQTLLSQGRPAVASSVQAPFVAANAVDGNTGTRWGSNFNNNEWIYVDLGATYNLSRVVLNWEAAYASGYQIQVSANTTTWTSIFTTTTGNGGIDDLAVTGTGRYVRVLCTVRATQFGCSLFEFQVFGTPVGTGTLLSQGHPAVASSVEAPFVAANAVDGNAGTRWSSAFTNNEWIYVDLGATATINRVVLNWEAAYGSGYQIQVSPNATNWTTIFTTTTGNGATDDLTVSGSGRYVRMLGTARATQWGYSLWEFQVFGTGGTNNNCAALPGAPTGLNASGVSSTSATINWTAPNPGANCTITNYLVFRNGAQVASSGGTSALINGLTANTTYSFTVAAVNGFGTGPQSGGLSVTTPVGTAAPIWQDEFDGAGQPNAANWNFLVGNGFDGVGFTGWGNGEWEWYRPENCFLRGGMLVLRADWLTTPMVIAGREWFQRSCRITTRGKRSFGVTPGRTTAIEARISIPSRIGTWPAFWGMGDSSDGTLTGSYNPPFDYADQMGTHWPSSGEIDILEHVNTVTQTTHNLFWDTRIGLQSVWCPTCVGANASTWPVADVTAFHVYRLERTTTEIRWYVDGVLVKTQSINDPTMADEFATQPFHIIMNLALAGSFPNAAPNVADFPLEMLVDYIRVYQF